MEKGRDLVEKAVRDLEASSRTSRTAAGPSDAPASADSSLVDAINQIFALFRLNYHNQYYSAYGDTEQLNQIKKLWLDSLASYAPATILKAAKRCIETSEYLPTLHRILECCRETRLADQGLPDAHAAYREACLAGQPRHAQRWTHPAVYHAGRETGWFFLASTAESIAFPAFERHYRAVCERLAEGETLELPPPDAPEAREERELSSEDQRRRLARLRAETGI